MESPNSPSRTSLQGVKGGVVWGTLALAVAAGYLTARFRPRVGTWLGLGCAALGVWNNRHQECEPAAAPAEVSPRDAFVEAAPRPPPEPAPTVGTLLLQVEPLPSVVEEAARGVVAAGQAQCLLDEAPFLAGEEASDTTVEGLWPSAGAAIPDAVELPELRET